MTHIWSSSSVYLLCLFSLITLLVGASFIFWSRACPFVLVHVFLNVWGSSAFLVLYVYFELLKTFINTTRVAFCAQQSGVWIYLHTRTCCYLNVQQWLEHDGCRKFMKSELKVKVKFTSFFVFVFAFVNLIISGLYFVNFLHTFNFKCIYDWMS